MSYAGAPYAGASYSGLDSAANNGTGGIEAFGTTVTESDSVVAGELYLGTTIICPTWVVQTYEQAVPGTVQGAGIVINGGQVTENDSVQAGTTQMTPSSTITLTGSSGIFVANPSVGAEIHYTPSVDGSLVILGAGAILYTVYDSDGDDIQDTSDDDLALVWVANQAIVIILTGTAGSQTFTWSYAARAASVMTITCADTMPETPGGLEVDIANGQPHDTIRFSLIGPTTIEDFQTTTLDQYGTTRDYMIYVPAADAGDYYLRVESDASGSEEEPLSILDSPLTQPAVTTPTNTEPTRTPMQHWRFFDLRDSSITWTFPRNPKSWTGMFPPNNFTHDKTTAPDGQPLTWQAADRPWRMEFAGFLDTEQEYNQLAFWAALRRRFWLIDHRNRAWLLTIEQFDAQAQVKANLPWAHEYTVKTLIFAMGAG